MKSKIKETKNTKEFEVLKAVFTEIRSHYNLTNDLINSYAYELANAKLINDDAKKIKDLQKKFNITSTYLVGLSKIKQRTDILISNDEKIWKKLNNLI